MKELNKSYIGIRKDLLRHIVTKNSVVLDVGCANGNNGKFLLDSTKASAVYGVEFDEEMAAEAETKNTKIFQGDLNDRSFLEKISQETPFFDYILFGDVLEHLINPEITLKILGSKLKEDGTIIISLPNIAHIELFIQVYLKGRWPKNDRGIFDKTHLSWFTKKDVFTLVESSGFKVNKYIRKYRSRDAIGSKFSLKYKLIKMINKDLVTFQHLVICSKNV